MDMNNLKIRLDKIDKNLKEATKEIEKLHNQIKDIHSLNITGIWSKLTKLSEKIKSLRIVSD